MSRQTNEERLVVLETKLDAVSEQIRAIDHKLEMMNSAFVSNVKHKDDLRDVFGAIGRNTEKIDRMSKQRWVQNTMAAAFGALLSLLIAYFVTNLGG